MRELTLLLWLLANVILQRPPYLLHDKLTGPVNLCIVIGMIQYCNYCKITCYNHASTAYMDICEALVFFSTG